MQAIYIDDWTSPADLRIREVPIPPCTEEAVRIRVRASTVSLALSLLVAGKYQRKPHLPFVPGNTVAGEVVEVGSRVRRHAVGDRVVASLEYGGLAQWAVGHEDNVYGLPAGMPFDVAVTLNSSYNSVAACLTWPHLLNVQPGQTLLVTGAAGGVGRAAVEIGRWLGATVVAAARDAAKRELARQAGAHHVVDVAPERLRDEVFSVLGGQGVDRAIDPVGGRVFAETLRCLKPEGRIVPIGFASGEIPEIPANLLLVKNITVCGFYMGYYKIDARSAQAQRVQDVFAELGRWWEAGAIRPVISGRFPLAETAAAFERVLDRQHSGHVIVDVD